MPPITALLHTRNDELRLGRSLEMLLPCAEILIVDHHSTDATRRIARNYGARIIAAEVGVSASHYLNLARHDWVLCLAPGESVTEGLQASLFEWGATPGHTDVTRVAEAAFSIFVREQTGESWRKLPAETRLIPRSWKLWQERLPAHDPSAVVLEGELLRFTSP